MAETILDRIVAGRIRRVVRDGAAQGLELPRERLVPVRAFSPSVICEVKRRSPSRGSLAAIEEPAAHAFRYVGAGVHAISVLTEQDHFGGSLDDLIRVKRAHPQAAILRKDFLLLPEDIRVSYRAGADAVLLIAAILDDSVLDALLREARSLGLSALVEVHDQEEIDRVRAFRPPLVGINSRDLRTFSVDVLRPLELVDHIDWPCRVVFESGVMSVADARFAWGAGFDAVLVGEWAVRRPEDVPTLVQAAAEAFPDTHGHAGLGRPPAETPSPPSIRRGSTFWRRVARLRVEASRLNRPLVKICGVNEPADAEKIAAAGADVLGCIFAESPRVVDPTTVAAIRDRADIPIVAVIVDGQDASCANRRLADEARNAYERGLVDALQVHGSLTSAVGSLGANDRVPEYAALHPKDPRDARALVDATGGPRFLLDAYDAATHGGTGMRVDDSVVTTVGEVLQPRQRGALWLAGGLGPENAADVVERYRPEMVDASSRLERAPGKKDIARVRSFMDAIRSAGRRLAGEDG